MKWRIISTVLLLGLAVATVASAQPSPRPSERQDRQQRRPVGPAVQQGQSHAGSNRIQVPALGQQPFTQRQQRYDWRNYQPGRRPSNWDRNRNLDRRVWEGNVRSDRSYRWRPYQRPSGWYDRRWEFGMLLPSLFWSRSYWINDYWQFGLMDPPYGYVWVRNANDALLVNVETGRILRVVYGVFYY